MDRGLLFELDTEFHWTYVEAAAGPRLLALHEAIKPQAERYVRLYTSALWGEVSTSVREHAVIIAAIAEGDEVEIGRASCRDRGQVGGGDEAWKRKRGSHADASV